MMMTTTSSPQQGSNSRCSTATTASSSSSLFMFNNDNDNNVDTNTQSSSSNNNPKRKTTTTSVVSKKSNNNIGRLARRSFPLSSVVAGIQFAFAQTYAPAGFERIPTTQFIAALGDPTSISGMNANEWGLWYQDPGPRGVWLRDYHKLIDRNIYDNKAPAGWIFSNNDWWLEEHGLIMEAPTFPLPSGRYLVTGGRSTTSILTVDEQSGKWDLDKGNLYDVTHLPCRSARYKPTSAVSTSGGTPANANLKDFPVKPGAKMPQIPGCDNVDYAVLFVIGKEKQRTMTTTEGADQQEL